MKTLREDFERLALEQIDAVDRVARSLARNSAEADDLVQETYLRALKAWESFDLKSFGIRPWLLRILHNLWVSRSIRESRQPRSMESEQLQAVVDPAQPMSKTWEASEELGRVLDQLPVDLQTTLTLWAVDDMSYQEIADILEIPIGTVMSRLHRARRRIAELLPSAKSRPVTRPDTTTIFPDNPASNV